MKHFYKRRGFTIVELVIVIAVIGILATVLVPTFSDIIYNAQLSAARSNATNLYKQYVTEAAVSGDIAETLAIHDGKDRYFIFLNGTLQEKVYSSVKEVRADHADAKLLQVTNGSFEVSALGYSNVVVVGHSWTLHPPYSDYWFEERGMAASVPGNDFVSFLELGMRAYQGDVSIKKINVHEWENNTADRLPDLDRLLSDDTDLVVIRLGENVPAPEKDTYDIYHEKLSRFITSLKSFAPNAEFVVCTTGLERFSQPLMMATENAGKDASMLIAADDFSSSDYMAQLGEYIWFPELASGDVIDDYNKIKTPGVDAHPSDVGMVVVANSVLKAIGYDEINVTYGIKYQEVTSSNSYINYTQWARNGLVTVNSTRPISVVTDSGRDIAVTSHGENFYTFFMPEEGVTVSANN